MEIQRCNVWRIMVDESELPTQAVTVFAWSSKKHEILHYSDERLFIFFWLILVACCWVLLSVGLIGSSTCRINHLVFWKELIIECPLPIPPYAQHHLLWVKTGLWCGWWWFISLAPRSLLFHNTVQHTLFITHHSLFLKWNAFITFKERTACHRMSQ